MKKTWLRSIFSRTIRNNSTKTSRKPVKLRLEALEERWCPAVQVADIEGTLSNNYKNVGDQLKLSDANFNNGAGFSGTVKNMSLTVNSNSVGVIKSTSVGTGAASSAIVGLGGTGASSYNSSNGRFFGSFTLAGTLTISGVLYQAEGYGTFDGTENSLGAVTSGSYEAEVMFGPKMNYLVWHPTSGSDWNNANNWYMLGTTTAPGSAPGATNNVVLFDKNVSNANSTYSTTTTNPTATILQNGYTGTTTVASGITFDPGRFVDNGIGGYTGSSNSFNVNFASSSSVLYINTPSYNYITNFGNINWGLGGQVEVLNASIAIGQGSSSFSCTTQSQINLYGNSELYLGMYKGAAGASMLTLNANAANIYLYGGDLVVNQTAGIMLTNNGTSAGIEINNASSSIDFVNADGRAESIIAAPLIIQAGDVYFGGRSYQVGASAADFKFTVADSYGSAVDMTGGNLWLYNGSLLYAYAGYLQLGGDLEIGDTTPVTLKVSSTSHTDFEGGYIFFNDATGPNSYGKLNISGIINMDGVSIAMTIKGGTSNVCDVINDTDATTNWTVTNRNTIGVYHNGTIARNSFWYLFTSYTGITATSDPYVHPDDPSLLAYGWGTQYWGVYTN